MSFQNRHTGTFPTVFHACGGPDQRPCNELWPEIRDWCFERPSLPVDDIEVVTPNSRYDESILERLLKRNGQKHQVVGRGSEPWRHTMKLRFYLAAAQNSFRPYLLFMDAYDVVYRGLLGKAIAVLVGSGKQALFNGDLVCHGTRPWPHDVPVECGAREAASTAGYRKLLNAGVWIARRNFALEFLARAVEFLALHPHRDEQFVVHQLFDPTTMAIDSNCDVFQTELSRSVLVCKSCDRGRTDQPRRLLRRQRREALGR